jgi:hypothetical protein
MSNAKSDDFIESYPKSRAAYLRADRLLRAARLFINIAHLCNFEDEHTAIKEYANLVKMDVEILTRYISALRWGGKSEYEEVAKHVIQGQELLKEYDFEGKIREWIKDAEIKGYL